MGRWAQRTRRGGGPGFRPPPTITIVSVTCLDPSEGTLIVVFSATVDVDDFDANSFIDITDGNPAEFVNQTNATTLEYAATLWQNTIAPGDTWLYNGTTADVVTPQTGLVI